MKLFGVLASAVLISTAFVSPAFAQNGYFDVNPSAADILTQAAIAALDEKAADKCDCSADVGVEKYKACVNKIIPGELAAFGLKKGAVNLLKFFGAKKGDLASALNDERDYLADVCEQDLSGDDGTDDGGDDDFGDEEDDFPPA